jgi:ComEC/Rec2-related protein
MPFITFFVWCAGFAILDFNLEPDLKMISAPLHNWCLGRLPSHSEWVDFYGALVCGHSPPPSPEKGWFQSTGLYHLLVVSGAHLMFIGQWLRPLMKRPWGYWLGIAGLSFYSFMCQGSPPVLRALLQLVLIQQNQTRRWHWSPPQLCFVSGVCVLLLFPQWVLSLSFWLSWVAAMVSGWAEGLRAPGFLKAATIQSLLVPALAGSGQNLPLSIAANWLLGPLLGKYLLILSILAVALPPVCFICDWAWSGLMYLLAALAWTVGVLPATFPTTVFLIAYTSFLNILWLGHHRWQRK